MFFRSEVIFRNTISTLFVRQIIVFMVQWNLNLRGNHLTNVRRIRKYLSNEATKTLVHALIIGRIDYCNSQFYMVFHPYVQQNFNASRTLQRD